MASFEPCSSFSGARPGLAFKMGDQGLGYYEDAHQPQAISLRAAAGEAAASASVGAASASACAAGASGRDEQQQQQQHQQQQQQQQPEDEDASPGPGRSGGGGGGGGGTAAAAAAAVPPGANAPAVVQKANPFLKLLKGKKVPPSAAAGGDAKRQKTGAHGGEALRPLGKSEGPPARARTRPAPRPARRPPALPATPRDARPAPPRPPPRPARPKGGAAAAAPAAPAPPKPAYLREMERYRGMSCASDTKHDRPLVK
jgi:hypothetical protein